MISIAGNIKPLDYTKKEWIIMMMIIPPFAVWISYMMFGVKNFGSFLFFLRATLPVLILLFVVYLLCGMMATIFLNRFPKYRNTFRRIGFSVVSYLLITIAGITLLFWGYDYVGYLNYEINIKDYFLVLAVSVILLLLATSATEVPLVWPLRPRTAEPAVPAMVPFSTQLPAARLHFWMPPPVLRSSAT